MSRKFTGWISAAGIVLVAALSAQGLAIAQGAASLYGPGGVSPQAVRQGTLGSCYFHASIAALAKSAPQTLRGAISRNPLGGYRVHFFDGPDEIVFQEDVEYGRAHSFDRSEGEWVLVLMRGYAQRALRRGLVTSIQRSDAIPAYVKPLALEWLNHAGLLLVAYDRAIRSVISQDGKLDEATLKQSLSAQLKALGIPSAEAQMLVGLLDDRGFFNRLGRTVEEDGEVFGAYKSLGMGGIPVRVIEAFTGEAHAGLVADHERTMKDLRRLHSEGVAMVAGSWSLPPSAAYSSSNWWVNAHSYTLLDFNEAEGTVKLRNPWGARPDPDGDFTLPLAVFLGGFESYSYSERPMP
jgi:hypothetical protein